MIKVFTSETTRRLRVLLIGKPNTFKSTALLSWPRPTVVMSYPGEEGWDTLRGAAAAPETQFTLLHAEVAPDESPAATIRDVETHTWEALATPGLMTFAGDGLHALANHYYKAYRRAIAGWVLVKGSKEENERQLDLTAYGNASSGSRYEVMSYLRRVIASPVPYVVFTCWEAPEPDRQGDRYGPAHVFPHLPGTLAKDVVGLFTAVLGCDVTLPDAKGNRRGTWQLQPAGERWGSGVKVPPEIAKSLPERMPMDFVQLERLLKGEPRQ